MPKCSECGFISARDWKTRQFAEIDDKKRCSGEIGSEFGGFEPTPICFINSFDIKEEVEILRKAAHDEPHRNSIGEYIPPHWATYVKVVLNTERKCKSFTKWQQGFTPKEHREMVDRERQRKEDRKWHFRELGLIIFGNILAACLGALLVYLVTRGG